MSTELVAIERINIKKDNGDADGFAVALPTIYSSFWTLQALSL